jgi:hypothetical protein
LVFAEYLNSNGLLQICAALSSTYYACKWCEKCLHSGQRENTENRAAASEIPGVHTVGFRRTSSSHALRRATTPRVRNAGIHRRHSNDRRRLRRRLWLCSGGACTSASCCHMCANMAPALDAWWVLTDPSPRPSPAAYASRGAPVLASRPRAPCIARDAAVHERTWCCSSWRVSRDP